MLRSIAVTSLLAVAIVVSEAAARTDALRFTTVARGTLETKYPGPSTSAFGLVANRIGDMYGTFGPVDRARIEALDFRKIFAIRLELVRPTGGYSLRIRRVTLQRVGASRQACVLVAIGKPRPGEAVRPTKTFLYEVVTLRRGRLGPIAADRVVFRDVQGGLVYATKAPAARTGLCRA